MSNILEKAIIDIECKFCGERCFVPLTTQAPGEIQQAYQLRNVNIMATCSGGRSFEKSLMGYSIVDILTVVKDYVVEPEKILEKGESVLCL